MKSFTLVESETFYQRVSSVTQTHSGQKISFSKIIYGNLTYEGPNERLYTG